MTLGRGTDGDNGILQQQNNKGLGSSSSRRCGCNSKGSSGKSGSSGSSSGAVVETLVAKEERSPVALFTAVALLTCVGWSL